MTIVALALTLSACNSNPFGKPSGDPTASPEAPATPPPQDNSGAGGGDGGEEPPPGVTFEIMKANIFNRNTCTRCHGDFEDYATVVENLGEIRRRINSTGGDRMPPSRSLTAEQKQLLETWIGLGTPQ